MLENLRKCKHCFSAKKRELASPVLQRLWGEIQVDEHTFLSNAEAKSLQASHRKVKINFEILISKGIKVDFSRDFLWEKRETGVCKMAILANKNNRQ